VVIVTVDEMATTQLPPTRVVSSKIVSPSEAHKFLSRFIQKADQDLSSHARGDLVLSDQRRIEQALQGVFVPKPKELSEEQVQGQTDVDRPLELTGANVQVSELANGKKDGRQWADGAVYKEAQRGKIPGNQGGAEPDDKQKRKADKKARLREEKRKRAEAREMEKQ
jgi:hypothetical protein